MSEVSAYCIDASGYSGWADKILVPADEQEVVEILKAASAAILP